MDDYSKESVDIIKKYFEVNEWHNKFDEETGIFSGGIKIEGKLGSVRFVMRPQDDYLNSFIIIGVSAEENVRSEVAEFITRANYGFKFGCFEMDFDDGELRYRMRTTLADLRDDVDKAMYLALILPCNIIEKYSEGLLSVLFGFSSAEDAVQKTEEQF